MGWEEGNNIFFLYLFSYCYVGFLVGRGNNAIFLVFISSICDAMAYVQ